MDNDSGTQSSKKDDDFLVNNPDDNNPMNDTKENEKLPNDVSDDTPFSKPDDEDDVIDPTSQQFDPASDIDSHELYDAGADTASGATAAEREHEEPN